MGKFLRFIIDEVIGGTEESGSGKLRTSAIPFALELDGIEQ